MCLHLVVMGRVEQPMTVALECCIMIYWLGATILVCMAYVIGLSMGWMSCLTRWLVLWLSGTEALMYSSFILVESRARSVVFPPEPASI